LKEEYLLTGELEQTNEPYAIAKIAGIKMCQAYHKQYGCNYISVMPTNLYGIGDHYNLHNSHVLPALVRKFHEARLANEKSVTVWGTGKPRREFLYVDDAAEACYFLMDKYDDPEIINVGSGKDDSIAQLALIIQNITGYKGDLRFDTTRPDGTMRKMLDVEKINNLGWQPSISLEEGIRKTYEDFAKNYSTYTK
jgi:GDP-L-fucose synthase